MHYGDRSRVQERMQAAKKGSQVITRKKTSSTQDPLKNARLPQRVRGKEYCGFNSRVPEPREGF